MPNAPVQISGRATAVTTAAAVANRPKVFVGETLPDGWGAVPGDLHIHGTTIKILNNASTPAWVTITVS